MYNYKLKEEDSKASKYQQKRIEAFDELESRLDNVKKLLRQGKIETIKTYREQPNTFAVVKPTDIIGDFIKDIEILLDK
jgi:soluble cytochrome b562|tara:strand:- start:468 stop:704 length:237 start_codon:yes stop_codon:yes gene_type:complete